MGGETWRSSRASGDEPAPATSRRPTTSALPRHERHHQTGGDHGHDGVCDDAGAGPPVSRSGYDRSIVDGPLGPAVWNLAWPSMLTNIVGGLQGIVDHVLVGHLVGYTANAAIGVSWQLIIVVIIFINSLFTGMSVLVARFAGAGDKDKVDRTVYQAFLTAIIMSLGIMAPLGYVASPWLLDLVNAAPAVKTE